MGIHLSSSNARRKGGRLLCGFGRCWSRAEFDSDCTTWYIKFDGDLKASIQDIRKSPKKPRGPLLVEIHHDINGRNSLLLHFVPDIRSHSSAPRQHGTIKMPAIPEHNNKRRHPLFCEWGWCSRVDFIGLSVKQNHNKHSRVHNNIE